MNFTVLFNDTKVEGLFRFVEEGNYSFVAISKYGTDVKEFSAVFIGEALLWHSIEGYRKSHIPKRYEVTREFSCPFVFYVFFFFFQNDYPTLDLPYISDGSETFSLREVYKENYK